MKLVQGYDFYAQAPDAHRSGRSADQIGHGLKAMFECVTADPLPDRLLQLADALEDAFQRGDLFDTRPSHQIT